MHARFTYLAPRKAHDFRSLYFRMAWWSHGPCPRPWYALDTQFYDHIISDSQNKVPSSITPILRMFLSFLTHPQIRFASSRLAILSLKKNFVSFMGTSYGSLLWQWLWKKKMALKHCMKIFMMLGIAYRPLTTTNKTCPWSTLLRMVILRSFFMKKIFRLWDTSYRQKKRLLKPYGPVSCNDSSAIFILSPCSPSLDRGRTRPEIDYNSSQVRFRIRLYIHGHCADKKNCFF